MTNDKRPVIGITCPWSEETWGETVEGGGYDYVGRAYVSAVYRAGGIPLLISPIFAEGDINKEAQMIINSVDGFYFTGGGNGRRPASVALPTLFDQQPARSAWEAELVRLAYKNDMPSLGVCRGHQMMGVVLGGSMDTVRRPEHKQSVPSHQGIHNINISKDSFLFDITGKESWFVNSIHVESVGSLPPAFEASATAEDGTIEAISAKNKLFFMGTQFHPELMPEDENSKKIFSRFISAAKTYKERK